MSSADVTPLSSTTSAGENTQDSENETETETSFDTVQLSTPVKPNGNDVKSRYEAVVTGE